MVADQSDRDRPDGEVIPLRATEAADETSLADTPAPAYLDTTDPTAIKRLPIIPVPLRRE